jgi:hypothetical protein
MIKAKRALASSKLLLAEKDADGACNRAYSHVEFISAIYKKYRAGVASDWPCSAPRPRFLATFTREQGGCDLENYISG